MHESAERPPDPSCHPGTRTAILDQLDKWSFEQPSNSPMLWLHGCAGIGKSAIAQQFAASCHHRSQLGGSFFFKRGSAGCGTWRNLVPTLAYQLNVSFPQLGPLIQHAVETDKLVLGKAMRHQLEKLFIQPFRDAPPLASRPILVIDGLDECEDRSAQTTLIHALIDILRSGDAPLHILICSRSEAHLREVFEAPESLDVCRGLEIWANAAASADIRRYLTEEFSRIYHTHNARGTVLGKNWPGEDTIEHLVKKSSGTFIYASTVLRYVDDEYSHPAKRLKTVCNLDPASLTALDDLYTQILSAIPNRPTLLRLLHICATMIGRCDPEDVDIVLQMPQGTSRALLRGLHAVVQVAPVDMIRPQKPIQFLHASFGDFLMDPQRSSSFSVSGEELQKTLVHEMACALLSSASLEIETFRLFASAFLACLPRIQPSAELLLVFRNVDFQHKLFSSIRAWGEAQTIITWLKRFYPASLDLIRIWGKFSRLASAFELPLLPYGFYRNWHLPPQSTVTSSNYDYSKISTRQYLQQSADLLDIIRISTVLPPEICHATLMHDVLDLLALKWDALLPLIKITEPVNSVDLEDIQDFLRDPDKCGDLWMPRDKILRFTALQCIHRMKGNLRTKNFIHFNEKWISILCHCEPDAEVLDALKDLDFTPVFSSLELDPEYHRKGLVDPAWFADILEWIQKAHSPPPQLIRSWGRQKRIVEECYARLGGPDN
ncbi:hypothetical protein FB45DRAFT_789482, partial [Roridomyces roridus]